MTDAAAPRSFLSSLGARARRRAEPRPSIALAGAGCAVAVLGVLVLSVDSGVNGGEPFNRWPGLILSALVVAAGLVAQRFLRVGPVATAGTVALVIGVPALLVFVTLDPNDFPPFSPNAILVLSTLAFVLLFTVSPGRGRPAFLGAAAVGVWATVLQLTEHLFDWPVGLLLFFTPLSSGGYSDDDSFGSLEVLHHRVFDPTTIGLLSLAFGVGYVLLSRRLDRDGYGGVATPLLVAGLPALYVGTTFLSDDLDATGTGALAIAIGLGLALHGSSVGRRATTWIGGVAVVLGIGAIVSDIADSASAAGALLLVLGAAAVACAHLLADRTHEPSEMVLTAPSRRTPPTT